MHKCRRSISGCERISSKKLYIGTYKYKILNFLNACETYARWVIFFFNKKNNVIVLLCYSFRENQLWYFGSCLERMTGPVKELCLQFFLLMNIYHVLEATWHETVDNNGETKIYHTIPRIKRLQDFQQNVPLNVDRSRIPYDEYPVRW